MSRSIQFGGRVSARLGAALSMVCELTRAQGKFSSDVGFHPAVGFMPKTRELSPVEEKLFTASLQYLKAGFQRRFTEVNSRTDAIEFSMWIYAANTYMDFVLTCTTEFDCKDFDAPPHIVGRVLSELEQETADAAALFLISGYEVKMSDAMVAEVNRQLEAVDTSEEE